jgi:hypothetical protein
MEEKSTVIQCAEYEPPRVLRMDLTNQLPYCTKGDIAGSTCQFGGAVG